jgi:hypothetical protein
MTWVVEISPRMPIRGFRYERRDGHLATPLLYDLGVLDVQLVHNALGIGRGLVQKPL